jgi:hypothetical protein
MHENIVHSSPSIVPVQLKTQISVASPGTTSSAGPCIRLLICTGIVAPAVYSPTTPQSPGGLNVSAPILTDSRSASVRVPLIVTFTTTCTFPGSFGNHDFVWKNIKKMYIFQLKTLSCIAISYAFIPFDLILNTF